MTVTSTTARVTANGNGVATSFSFSPIVIHASTHLEVTKVASDGTETLLTEGSGTSNYAVVVASYPGTGSITYPASGSTYLATGESLVIRRIVPLKQELDLQNQGRYLSANVENALDKLTMMVQQLDEEMDRAITLPVSSDATDIEIPDPEASKYIRWNSAADALENADLSDASLISLPVSVGNGGTGATTAAGARTALGLGTVAVENTVPVAKGGTNATTAADARTSLAVPGTAANNVFSGTNEFDAASTFDGAVTANGAVTMNGAVTVASADAGAAVGPSVKVQRNSASPANNDVTGSVDFEAKDDAAATTIFSTIYQTLTNVAAAAKAAKLTIKNYVAGAATDILHIGSGLWMQGATGGDPGAGKINCTELQINGVALTSTWTYGAQVSVNSGGAAIELISTLPSNVSEIEVFVKNVSQIAVGSLFIQLGDAGGYETTGYEGATRSPSTSNPWGSSIILSDGVTTAADNAHAVVRLSRWDPDEHTWFVTTILGEDASGVACYGAGWKTMSEALTSIRIDSGQTFDGTGVASVRYR